MDDGNANKLKIVALFSSIGCLPLFFMVFSVFIAVFLVLGLFEGGDGSGGGMVSSNNGECGFTISQTSLSKTEFKRLIQEYADSHSQWQVFATNANDYYDYAKAKGVNPELVVLIASKEGNGYETSGSNNYWGLACPNGATSCGSYGSFMEGAKLLIESASKYNSLMDWFDVGHYSWIGDYWYNPGDWGLGGCAYATYIYPDNMPDRVKRACAPGNECSGSSCVPTEPEDQTAYATWLIADKMAKPRETIFGLAPDEGVSCTYGAGVSSNSVIESYVQWMINFAADDTHGYSQDTRYMNPNVDCSSFVYYALRDGAGFIDSEDQLGSVFTTDSMAIPLKRIGFKAYNYTSQDGLQRGDILYRDGHTEVYVGNGQNVGAHTNKDGKDGDSSGEEVDIGNTGNNWTLYFRYEGED